jgi:hypothetical protein
MQLGLMFGFQLLIMFFSMLISSSCARLLKAKNYEPMLQPFICFISLFLIIIFLFTFTSFLKLKPKNQTTIKHKYNIHVFLFFSMANWYVITIIVASQQLAFHQHYGAMMIMVALIVEANGTPRKNLYGHMTKQVAS